MDKDQSREARKADKVEEVKLERKVSYACLCTVTSGMYITRPLSKKIRADNKVSNSASECPTMSGTHRALCEETESEPVKFGVSPGICFSNAIFGHTYSSMMR